MKLQLKQNEKLIKERNFSSSFTYNNSENNHDLLQYQRTIEINLTNKIFEKGYSGLDLMEAINHKKMDEIQKYGLLIHFDNIRREFRNEKLLIFYILTFTFMRPKSNL